MLTHWQEIHIKAGMMDFLCETRWKDLRDMCETGADAFSKKLCDVVKFELYNEQEKKEVDEIMKREFSNVKYFTTVCFGE